jgi:hypothetical protein
MNDHTTVSDLAHALGVTKNAVINRIRRGTLDAEKVNGVWRIPRGEYERVVNGAPMNGAPTVDTVRTKGAPTVDTNGAQAGGDDIEVAVLREKLSAAEQHHESTRRELDASQTANDQLRQDHDHTRRLLENALDSIGSLTEQMKAQSILQHQLQQHRALEAPPPDKPVKPSLLRRWFGQSKRGRQVRIGHA